MFPRVAFFALIVLVLSTGFVPTASLAMDGSGKRTIEGRIAEVRESFPPQLVIESDDGKFEIGLSDATAIQVEGRKRSYEALQTGKLVRIDGTSTSARSLTAERILLLEEIEGRIANVLDKPTRLVVARDGREVVVLLGKDTVVLDAKGKASDRTNLRKDVSVRLRFYRQEDTETKKTVSHGSSVKILPPKP